MKEVLRGIIIGAVATLGEASEKQIIKTVLRSNRVTEFQFDQNDVKAALPDLLIPDRVSTGIGAIKASVATLVKNGNAYSLGR